jgi:hypothetical protein
MTTHGSIQLGFDPPSTAIVSVAGTLGREAREELVVALDAAGEREHIVVDLSRADSVDPSLVNALQQACEHLAGTPARLELVIPVRAHALRSLFETVGATSIASAHPTRARALAALARPRPDAAARPERSAA